MAITSLDGVLAGFKPPLTFNKAVTPTLVIGRPHSLFYLAGIPGAASAPTPGVAGAALTSYAGQIPYTNPSSGNSYLAKFWAQSNNLAGTLLLCDRLWHNSGLSVTSTSLQSVNSVTFPARDNNGSTNGEGVLVGVEVTTATGSGTPTLTLTYTNSAGTSGRTATNVQATAASSAVGAFYEFDLATGDLGVRSIQSYQQSTTWTSGAISLVAYRILAELQLPVDSKDVFALNMVQCYNNTVPFLLFIPTATTAAQIRGGLCFTHG